MSLSASCRSWVTFELTFLRLSPFSPRSLLVVPSPFRSCRLSVPLVNPPYATTLLDLRQQLSTLTSLPPQSFKLVFAGGVMTADDQKLSQYGIKDGSVLAIIGKPGAKEQILNVERELSQNRQAKGADGAPKKGELQTQPKLVESIRAKVKVTKDALGNQVEEFEQQVSPHRSIPMS